MFAQILHSTPIPAIISTSGPDHDLLPMVVLAIGALVLLAGGVFRAIAMMFGAVLLVVVGFVIIGIMTVAPQLMGIFDSGAF